MKLIKGSKSEGVDNSNPYYNPKAYRQSKQQKASPRSKSVIFGAIFMALILVLTSLIDRYWF
jgi:hypothetical protein